MTHGNYYTGAKVDRAGPLRPDAGWLAARLESPGARVVPVWREKNFIAVAQNADQPPRMAWLGVAAAAALTDGEAALVLLGERDNIAYFTADLSHIEDPAALPALSHGVFTGLRDVGFLLERSDGALLSYAKGLIHWHERHPFCARCGSPSRARDAGHVRVCVNPACKIAHFPRTDPAVIMLVHRGERCVLAHNRRNPNKMYSTLAGFLEPGESIEEAVAREVLEEVGITIGKVRYHSSQPWPFPGNIMLGFHAEAESTDIVIQESELVEARWFARDEIRDAKRHGLLLSRSESISRRLIEDWMNGRVE